MMLVNVCFWKPKLVSNLLWKMFKTKSVPYISNGSKRTGKRHSTPKAHAKKTSPVKIIEKNEIEINRNVQTQLFPILLDSESSSTKATLVLEHFENYSSILIALLSGDFYLFSRDLSGCRSVFSFSDLKLLKDDIDTKDLFAKYHSFSLIR